jgi:hypothetical protein
MPGGKRKTCNSTISIFFLFLFKKLAERLPKQQLKKLAISIIYKPE